MEGKNNLIPSPLISKSETKQKIKISKSHKSPKSPSSPKSKASPLKGSKAMFANK